MNYHQDPYLAAWAIHALYCPVGQKITPAELAQEMRITPNGSGRNIMEQIGQHVLDDPNDIPEFVSALSESIEIDKQSHVASVLPNIPQPPRPSR